MNNTGTPEKAVGSRPEILQQAFACFNDYVTGIVGPRKAREFCEHSYTTIEKYFRNLSAFEIKPDSGLEVLPAELSEREILAFSVWMQQYLKELKAFMIGLGRVDPVRITIEFRDGLEAIGFYEFFEQARELEY